MKEYRMKNIDNTYQCDELAVKQSLEVSNLNFNRLRMDGCSEVDR